eukprot:TRINITY_DN5308_c0_g1_i1.p1 TRINITY_DN5308_c0_g1~~TRINITY_DN5308_c0_g1_i1.p1  ORF type:complete len:249 (-),score=55.68 TRINITY_DN5308_c0_g1_i1:2-748(-)
MKILRINRELTPHEYGRLTQYYEEQEKDRIKEGNRKVLGAFIGGNTSRTYLQAEVGGPVENPDNYQPYENKLTAEQLVGLAMEPDYDFKDEESHLLDDLSYSSDSSDHPNRLPVAGEFSHSSKSRHSRISRSKVSHEVYNESPSKSKSTQSRAEGETKSRSSRIRRRKITEHRMRMEEHETKLEEMKQKLDAAKLKRGTENNTKLTIAIRKTRRKLEKMRRSGKSEFFGFLQPHSAGRSSETAKAHRG